MFGQRITRNAFAVVAIGFVVLFISGGSRNAIGLVLKPMAESFGWERTVLLSTHVMQEVEATCSRLVILRNGELAAEGTVQDLVSSRSGGARYVVEAVGDGAEEALRDLPGVSGHRSESVEGRVRVHLDSGDASELRPDIYALARERGWTLWELHREQASLEQLFRTLTADEGGE